LDRYGLERRLRLVLIKPVAQDVCVNAQAVGERRNECAEVLPFEFFTREDDIVDRARVNKDAALAVEDRAALRRNRQQPDALILRALGVISAARDLQIIEAHTEHGEQN